MKNFKPGDKIARVLFPSSYMGASLRASVIGGNLRKISIDLDGNDRPIVLHASQFKYWHVIARVNCEHSFIELDNEGVFSSKMCRYCGKEVRG